MSIFSLGKFANARLDAAENDQNLELPQHDVEQHLTGLEGSVDLEPPLLCPPTNNSPEIVLLSDQFQRFFVSRQYL